MSNTKGFDDAFAVQETEDFSGSSGLTKREYFAIEIFKGLTRNASEQFRGESAAKVSVSLADVLLKELNK